MGRFAFLKWWILYIKKKNHDRDIDKLNVRVTEFIMMRVWFVTKWGGEGCCFLKEEKK